MYSHTHNAYMYVYHSKLFAVRRVTRFCLEDGLSVHNPGRSELYFYSQYRSPHMHAHTCTRTYRHAAHTFTYTRNTSHFRNFHNYFREPAGGRCGDESGRLEDGQHWVSLPGYFKTQGYTTLGI